MDYVSEDLLAQTKFAKTIEPLPNPKTTSKAIASNASKVKNAPLQSSTLQWYTTTTLYER